MALANPTNQKTGLMPEWTWTEGVVDSTAEDVDAPTELIAQDETRYEFHLSVEPALAIGRVFAEQTRTVSEGGARGGAGDIYTTRAPGFWAAQMAYEDVGEQPTHVYLVEVPEASEGDPLGSLGQQTITAAGNARVVAYLGEDTGAASDAPFDIGRFEYLRDRWLKRNTPSQRFLDAFLAAKNASPYGAAVHAYTPAEYAKMRLFLAPDGLSGFALKGDDIVSVFSHPASGGGRARKIIDVAVANGGRTLDCFDGKLVQIYSALGFREVRRENWNDEYRPEGWKDEWGKPDVVYMEYAGADVEQMVAAPLFGGNRLEVEASGPRGQPRVRDVAQALQDRHNLLEGGKLFPESSEADYERVLQMGLADFRADGQWPLVAHTP